MHSFIVTSQNFPEDQYHLHIIPETSIGIDDVRSVQTFLSKKPISGKKNIAILHDAHLLTQPAQQAILKTLEEPPGDSEVYLVTTHPDTLLPTILSRCQIATSHYSSYASNATYMTYVEKLLSSNSVGDRLELLDSVGLDRKTALDLLDQFELHLHNLVILTPQLRGKDPEKIYNLIFETRKFLRANCNLRLVLTNLAQSL